MTAESMIAKYGDKAYIEALDILSFYTRDELLSPPHLELLGVLHDLSKLGYDRKAKPQSSPDARS